MSTILENNIIKTFKKNDEKFGYLAISNNNGASVEALKLAYYDERIYLSPKRGESKYYDDNFGWRGILPPI